MYDVTTSDPVTLTSAVVGTIMVTLLATSVPARRVTRVDPVLVLRDD